MIPKTYIETTIVSYLGARPSRDLITAAHQRITHDWWETQSRRFDLYVSQVVLQEAQGGDPEAASRRLQLLQHLPVLELTEEARSLAEALIQEVPLPPKATLDAVHIALAAVNGMHYLLTWNCAHIASAFHRPKIEAICRKSGFEPPVICTPEELMEKQE